MSSIDLAFALCAAALVLMIYYAYWRPIRSTLPLPPGPKKLPFIGNIFDLPPDSMWETYTAWSRKFDSDIIHLSLGGQSVVVLSSSTATDDLLEKRSAIYSDRPTLPMYVDIVGWDFNFVVMKYGNKWRAHRRLFSQAFNSVGSKRFRPNQLAATRRMLNRFLATPNQFSEHIRQMAGELIINIGYGIEALPVNDPYVALAEEGVKAGSDATIPGKFLVDSFPILRYIPDWFPGAGFKRQAKEWRKVAHALRDVPFAECKRLVESGTAHQSFIGECLQHLNESGQTYYDEDTIKGTAATMYLAGSDTVVSVLTSLILAMLANPTAQRKAQMEIDSVTGGTRLPDFNDEEALPYTAAVVKELFRWHPVTPIGLPHFLRVEDEYRGYRLPANSIVIGNIWAILHDENMYPDPYSFKPERFLLDGKPNPHVRDPQATFGFGRRICPGQFIGASSVFISVASILASFDITKAIGDDGAPIEPTYEYSTGLVHTPLPFKCSIRPRSQSAIAVIEAGLSEDQYSSAKA
ncbi:cytochrome P450 [Mycena metata]|uniref:Cytochrome P450 n=1 Tax=Mycena metata TaxID=1033252 RepID=A0AAD7IRC9_9AGAR|nr:cytochrome P450 [Mycena metata]